jgi:outer membrane protein assembly factor BamB
LALTRRGRRLLRIAPAVAAAAAAGLVALAWGFLLRPDGGGEVEAAASWAFVNHDPGNSRCAGLAEFSLPDRAVWAREVEGAPGFYKPLAGEGLVVVGTLASGPRVRLPERAVPRSRGSGPPSRLGVLRPRGGGGLVAFDAETGRVRWRREFESGDFLKAKAFPDRCLHEGRLYVADGESCLALDAATGKLLREIAPPAGVAGWSYLAAGGGRLYGCSRDGLKVFCVDAARASGLWCRKLARATFVPALSGETLFVHTDDGAVAALDAGTGSELWRTAGATPGGEATVHAAEGKLVVLTARDELVSLDPSSGRLRWRREVGGAYASGLALGGGAAYLRGGTLALTLTDGRRLWRRERATGRLCSSPTALGACVLSAAGSAAGELNVIGPSGRRIGGLDDAARSACDGAIVLGDAVYTVAGGRSPGRGRLLCLTVR